ncbi:exonuclease domain-containing protein [Streptomyces sp. NBC_00038]|uniref:exonuclease domain-containing protein n=1 Tax=Streptomyces sp. NBC_00038 TaxID=2903615 RepID=UPI002259C2AA|nr:exonuclease domain-containing protein [Streptomyces sp. NBC_00038]MCX5562759.1 exonuclease domain-containing protein [Streptomyces sp. NBC_00038]MCX5563591.1 exonuclease domain-containing protein [Streptomyces sp. NBC_00038]
MTWHLGRWAAFDLETTGVDVENDRIVTAAVHARGGGIEPEAGEWLADPGVEIPAEAYDVHKISTEHAREHGAPAEQVVREVAAELAAQVTLGGAAIVGHNVPFDLTLLDRECRRYGLPTLLDLLDGRPLYVIDTRVLDQRAVPFRKRVSEKQGARQLITLAQFYGVPWDEEKAHGCSFDAIAAASIAYRIALLAHMRRADWPDHVRAERRVSFMPFRDLTVAELHEQQIEWAAEQAAGLQKHFQKTDPNAVVDGAWPLRPWVEPTAAEGALA